MIIYIAAPFRRYKEAYRAECTLREAGLIPDEPTNRWIGHAMRSAGEDLSLQQEGLPSVFARAAANIRENDEDVGRCDLLLALAYPDEGGEMFAEVARALHLGKPVAWVGERLILSCFRQGVTIYPSVQAVADALRSQNGIST